MKHRLLPALAAALLLSLSACGQDTPGTSAGGSSPSPSSSDSGSSSPEPTPSPTPTDSPSATGDPVTVSPRGLPQGEAPALAYLQRGDGKDWILVRPDAAPIGGLGPYYAFAMTGDASFVGMRIGDASVVDVVDASSGTVTHSEKAIGYQLAVTPDGQMVGWLRPRGVPVDYEVGSGAVLTGPRVEHGTDLAALAGKGTCQEAESEVNGCLWLVTDASGERTWGASSHGIVDQIPGIRSVSDVDDRGFVIGLSSVSDDGSCSVLKHTFAKPVWETCDYRLRTFSPDATRISASNAYGDGLGDTQLAILDRDGKVEQEFRAARNVTFISSVWEDEDHLLVLTYRRNSWSILRLGVDGSVELAEPELPGSDDRAPLVLPTR